MKNRLIVARQFSLVDWLIMSLAWWILLWYALYLKWGSFDYPVPPAESEPPKSRFVDFAQRLHRLVELASRLHPFPMTCLPRALTLRRLLAWYGFPSLLRIGVAGKGSGMQAHAWIDVAGVPVGEAKDVAEKFSILENIPAHPAYKFSP